MGITLTWRGSGRSRNPDLSDEVVHGNPQLVVHVHDSASQGVEVEGAVPNTETES